MRVLKQQGASQSEGRVGFRVCAAGGRVRGSDRRFTTVSHGDCSETLKNSVAPE